MLKILTTKIELQEWKAKKTDIGFVPTMGNLHQGHLSLVEKSFRHHQNTLISIFVNPTQFNNADDLKNYPRTLTQDLELLELLHKTYSHKELVVFAPLDASEVYPTNFDTQILPGKLATKLCGFYRPGHFSGVCSVVYHLLHLAGAKSAYFGKKDYQQYLIVKKMVEDLSLKTEIVPCELVRDEKGLALSSRNNRLSEDQKISALNLIHALKALEAKLLTDDYLALETLKKKILSEDKQFEYLEILDASNLEAYDQETQNYLIAGAYFVGSVRLIDNIVIKRGTAQHA
jgi:pantoate--beta-alanine ligase